MVSEQALSTDYAFQQGVYRGRRTPPGRQPRGGRRPGGRSGRCPRGRSLRRTSTLRSRGCPGRRRPVHSIQEIWRLLLVCHDGTALLIEAALMSAEICVVRKESPYELRLARSHPSVDARLGLSYRRLLLLGDGRFMFSSPGDAAATELPWDCWNCYGWRWFMFAALMINQPEIIEEFRPEEKAVGCRTMRCIAEHGHTRRRLAAIRRPMTPVDVTTRGRRGTCG